MKKWLAVVLITLAAALAAGCAGTGAPETAALGVVYRSPT